MNFLPTIFIFPLKEPFCISRSLKIYLDNPRTDEEIEAVKRFLEQSYAVDSAFTMPEDKIKNFLMDFSRKYSKKDHHIKEMLKAFTGFSGFEFLARIWIVARYDDEGQTAELESAAQEYEQEGSQGFFMLEDDNPIIKNSRQLAEVSHLISLLVHTENDYYEGRSFLLEYEQFWQEKRPSHFACLCFITFLTFARSQENSTDDSAHWQFFPIFREKFEEISTWLEIALSGSSSAKFIYIASMLKTAGEDIKDNKTQLVVLVGVIELLLTHNPDFNRFNVEDSINKQFQLKAGILIYLNDRSQNLNILKSRLKEIYGLRSSIAHGDFKAVTKYIEKMQKSGKNYPMAELVSETCRYLRAIILECLKDDALIEFLKDG